MQAQLLSGVTVIDLAQAGPGPLAAAMLGDYGADVISVEPPGGGSQRHLAKGSVRPNFIRNKRSIELNLKADDADSIFDELVRSADVLIHNYSSDVATRLGCDYKSLQKLNEGLIYCSVTGYGEDGPYSNRPCLDPHAQAMSGLMSITGEPDRKPSRVGASLVSFATSQMAVFGISAALWQRDRSDRGQKIEVSLFDTAGAAMSYWYSYYSMYDESPTRRGDSWDGYAPAGVFETDDDPVYLAIPFQSLWKTFCDVLEKPEWISDPRFATDDDRLENREQLTEVIEAEFQSYTREELLDELLAANIPVSKVQTVPEAAYDDHLDYRGTVTDLEDVDGNTVRAMGLPITFSETPGGIEHGPPEAGEHSREILAEIGFSDDKIRTFLDEDVISEPSREE
jgi:crotonobetainyl-CoA:carnitine CoA-transferase CaiB-like acyl-CoA transferase